MPSVSIIIPCYNQGHFLNAAVGSVVQQTFKDWECIIINDGSTDNTSEIAYALCSGDNRIKYYHKSNGGLSSARNEGLKHTKGEYIQFLDADDLLESEKLKSSISIFNSDPYIDLVICNFVGCNKNHTIRFDPYCDLSLISFDFENVLLNWDKTFTIPIHCGLFKSVLFSKFKFVEELGAKEDWLMWLEIFLHSPKAVFINQSLAIYRMHSNSMSMNRTLMYENTASAFLFINDHYAGEKYRLPFFEKINMYWKGEAQKLNNDILNYQKMELENAQRYNPTIKSLLRHAYMYLNNKILQPTIMRINKKNI